MYQGLLGNVTLLGEYFSTFGVVGGAYGTNGNLTLDVFPTENLTAEEVGKLADVLVTRDYNDGEFIIRQGEQGDYFYILAEVSACGLDAKH